MTFLPNSLTSADKHLEQEVCVYTRAEVDLLLMKNVLKQLVRRVIRRALEIPKRGLPSLRTNRDSFDQEWGIETSKIVWLTNLGSANYVHGVRYEGCDPAACMWAIQSACISPSDFYFIDVGCGKGRPLIIASRFPFERLIGVEYSAKLCRHAEDNLRHCGVAPVRFEILCKDAAEFEFPDRNLFVWFYNPFNSVVLEHVLANLQRVARRRKVLIAFQGKGRHRLDACGWLMKLGSRSNVSLFQSS